MIYTIDLAVHAGFDNMLLSIITINYKTPVVTLDCIRSVYNQYETAFNNNELEYIIVDNASGDGSFEIMQDAIIKSKYKNIHIIGNKENGGFSKGCNIGASRATGTYLLFLNSDTEVKDQGITAMTTFLSNHKAAAIVGGKMKNTDGTAQISAWKFYTLGNLLLMLLGAQRFGLAKLYTTRKVDWVTGGCLLIKNEIFILLHGFDEHIFMYVEDMDLCFRARKQGYDTYFYTNIDIIHKSHGSSNRAFAILNIYKNILYFYKKHMPTWQYPVAAFLLKSKAYILVIIGKVTGNTYLTKTYEQTLAVF